MPYDPYSRTNQQILEGAVVGISFWLAFIIRFEGVIPPYHKYQLWALLVPMVVGRLLTNRLFGLYRIQWRYIGFRDVLRTSRAYVAFSAVLLLARFGLPVRAEIIRVPASVITIELLLSLLGAMSIRLLRRYLHEHQAREANALKAEDPERLLLIGAGMIGANAAKEMASNSCFKMVGL